MPAARSFTVLRYFVLLFVWLTAASANGAEPGLLPEKLRRDGWIQLFDGQTLHGWQPTSDADWRVVDGEIRTSGEKAGFLMTTTRFARFKLHVEFRAPAATNSGVFLSSVLEPTDPTKDCYEVNIAPPDNPFPTGSIVGRKKMVWPQGGAMQPGVWHSIDINVESKGHNWTVRIDGRRFIKYVDRTPIPLGHIGLQSNQGPIAFRNIRLRPLDK